MYTCKSCGNRFEHFEEEKVFWSSDTLPVCPCCGVNAYEGEFEIDDKPRIGDRFTDYDNDITYEWNGSDWFMI